MLEDLVQAHRSGRFDEAEAGYRQLLAEHPEDPGVLCLLGTLRAQRGAIDEGLQLVTRAAELAPDNAACQRAIGDIQLGRAQLDAAKRAYEQARRLNPNLAAARSGLGQIALLQGDTAAAEGHFRVALRADADDVAALTGLGKLAGARGDTDGALRWLAQAATLAPHDVRVQVNYAHALLDRGSLDFAAQALDNALAVQPGNPLARVLRAEVHVRKGELAAAEAILQKLIARGEQLGPAYTLRGDIARLRGYAKEAAVHYGAAVRAQPGFARPVIRRADALARSGNVEQALTELRAYAARHPDDASIPVALASLLSHADRRDEAIAVWQDAAARWPDNAEIIALYAFELDTAGEHEEAVALATRTATLAHPLLTLLRARGALLGGDPAGAVERLKTIDPHALEQRPQWLARRCHRLLGLAYDDLEQWPDAVAAFMQAQHATPGTLVQLPDLTSNLRAALRTQAAGPALVETAGARAPVLLCGLPGSGVEQVAALLTDQPHWTVRRDRFAAAPDFISAAFDERLLAAPGQGQLAVLARHYRRPLERNGLDAAAPVIDWVPVLDARVVPAIKRALPGTRLLVVAREPGDMLLDWLAFGWQDTLPMPDPLTAARWLHVAGAHLKAAAHLLPSFTVDPEALLAAGGGAARRQLGEFLDGHELTWGPQARAARKGLRGLPANFPRDHAAHYRTLLADAFLALGEGGHGFAPA